MLAATYAAPGMMRAARPAARPNAGDVGLARRAQNCLCDKSIRILLAATPVGLYDCRPITGLALE